MIESNRKYTVYTNNTINSIQILECGIERISMAENMNIATISAYYFSGNNNTNFSPEFSNLFQALDIRNINIYYILVIVIGVTPLIILKVRNYDWSVDSEIDFKCKLYASEMTSSSQIKFIYRRMYSWL